MQQKTTPLFKLLLVLFLLLCSWDKLTAQTINNAPSQNINQYQVLPDSGFTFEQITATQGLNFKHDALRRSVSRYYWVKIILTNPYPDREAYVLHFPNVLQYTLYNYDGVKWISKDAGLKVANGRRRSGSNPFFLLPGHSNTLYLKVDLGKTASSAPLKPSFQIEKQIVYDAGEQTMLFSYVLCCIALISFLMYNLYLYFHLKDKVYTYYVVIQIGALMYLSGIQYFFNVLLPVRMVYLKVWPDGFSQSFSINGFFMHVGVLLIFWGLCLFTRAYLSTEQYMPRLGKVLKILPFIYLVLMVVTMICVSTRLYNDLIIVLNVLIIFIILSCLIAGVLGNRRNVPSAKHYLAAMLIPATASGIISVCIILFGESNALLPPIAILSQILTFAVALVARIKTINYEFNKKTIETFQMEAEHAAAEDKRLILEQEYEISKLSVALERERNDHLQQTLSASQRELAGNSLHLHQKTQLLANLTKQINSHDFNQSPSTLRDIQTSLKNNTRLDDEWKKFKLHFEQVHPDFFTTLKNTHPGLTQHELRLCAYFQMNLSTKEIATLLNIAAASVRQAKTRLYKKLNLKESGR